MITDNSDIEILKKPIVSKYSINVSKKDIDNIFIKTLVEHIVYKNFNKMKRNKFIEHQITIDDKLYTLKITQG